MSTKKPMTADERREQAIKFGVQFARKVGAQRVTVSSVAAKCGVSGPLLFHIFGTAIEFQKAIIKQAKKDGVTLALAEPTWREKRSASKRSVVKAPRVVVPSLPV